MDELIEALQIFLKYGNETYPTHCKHDVLTICGDYHKDKVSQEDLDKLEELGFFWDDGDEYFYSFRYGSC